jgi:hypothetical protein
LPNAVESYVGGYHVFENVIHHNVLNDDGESASALGSQIFHSEGVDAFGGASQQAYGVRRLLKLESYFLKNFLHCHGQVKVVSTLKVWS